jgi:hypothetical protein
MERARRQIAPNAKAQALAQLADLKKNGLKRSDQFNVRERRLAHPTLPLSNATPTAAAAHRDRRM